MKLFVVAIVAAISLAACSDSYDVRPVRPSTNPAKHIVYKNYEIGAVETAYVGAPVVRVKDYYVTSSFKKGFISPVAFSGSMEDTPTVNFGVGAKLFVTSEMEYNDTEYFVAKPKTALQDDAGLLVTANGRYSGLVTTRDDDGEINIFKACNEDDDICIRPGTIQFNPMNIESLGNKALKRPGFINYEIIYSGATNDTINLLYREYTPDDMARAAYSQNLTYDRTSSTLRFRNVKIRVINANNQSLQYVVEADGLKQTSNGN